MVLIICSIVWNIVNSSSGPQFTPIWWAFKCFSYLMLHFRVIATTRRHTSPYLCKLYMCIPVTTCGLGIAWHICHKVGEYVFVMLHITCKDIIYWMQLVYLFFYHLYVWLEHPIQLPPPTSELKWPLYSPYPEPVVIQWQSSGNPVCLELRPKCTLEWHWRKNCW